MIAIHDRFRAGEADDTDFAAFDRRLLLFESLNGVLDTLGEGQHLFTELGEAIAARMALHEFAAELAFQLNKPALHG